MDVIVRIDVAEPGANWVIDKKKVRKFVPGTVVKRQRVFVLDTIRAYLHQCTILGAAPGAAVEPDDGSLSVRDMLIFEMPEEEIAIVLRGDLDVTVSKHDRLD
jgi:hypothetical protein